MLGAFLPWVTVGEIFGISGVSAQYGIATLVVGLLALVAAFGTGKIFDRSKRSLVVTAAAVLGAIAVAISIFVGFAIRDSVAKDETEQQTAQESTSTGDEELDQSLENFGADLAKTFADAFKVSTGIGVYATLLGGALVVAGGFKARRESV